MTTILMSVDAAEFTEYAQAIREACAARGTAVELADAAADPATIDVIVYTPAGPVTDFTPFTRLRAVLSLWAGVERVVGNPTLKAPLCRMVDPGLTEGMIEYVTGHVLRHHLGLDAVLAHQDGIWRAGSVPPLARERRVGMLGLGALGAACARALAGLGFAVSGWSRRPAEVPGVACHTGADGLAEVLATSDIVVILLPATPETDNLLDATRIAQMKPGAVLINPGRGTLVDDAALLAALDSGQLSHATLDVFRTEPLPPDHPFWSHPRVTVTPHIAATTRPETSAPVIAENIARIVEGRDLLYRVDRAAGY
jgi:glyoxylate/hydroxypyruvate reductase A